MKKTKHTLLIGILLITSTIQAQVIEPVMGVDADNFGTMIPRTMQKFASSTPDKRNLVKILFYGQSITLQDWWKVVVDDLKRRYPHALIEAENLAIGGQVAPLLLRAFYHDVPPAYPDLIFFHVYNANDPQYEEMLREMRERTTAEIMISTHHQRQQDKENNRVTRDLEESEVIRRLAKKYSCELVEVENEWKATLAKYKLAPEDLLKDSVHLNAKGEDLMAKLVSRHFRVVKGARNPMSETIRDIPTQADSQGIYILTFKGNRVDVLFDTPKALGRPGAATVLLDGKPLSQFGEFYSITRTSEVRGKSAIRRISNNQPLIAEDWTLTVTKAEDNKIFSFNVSGSATGADGSGISNQRFVSKSGRVVIEPMDWGSFIWYLKHQKDPLPENFKITWSVKPNFLNTLKQPETLKADRENIETLFHGGKTKSHTLTIIPKQKNDISINTFRVHTPPMSESLSP